MASLWKAQVWQIIDQKKSLATGSPAPQSSTVQFLLPQTDILKIWILGQCNILHIVYVPAWDSQYIVPGRHFHFSISSSPPSPDEDKAVNNFIYTLLECWSPQWAPLSVGEQLLYLVHSVREVVKCVLEFKHLSRKDSSSYMVGNGRIRRCKKCVLTFKSIGRSVSMSAGSKVSKVATLWGSQTPPKIKILFRRNRCF